MKKIVLLSWLLIANTLIFAQRINVVFSQAGLTCKGSAGGDYFVLEVPGQPLCVFDYSLYQDGNTYVMAVFNPRQRGFIPATYYLYQDGTMHVVANGSRFSGWWSYEGTTESSQNSNPSFKGQRRGSCNITSHHCPNYRDADGDNYCDHCKERGYDCHAVNHQPR